MQNEYSDLVKKAHNKRIQLTKNQVKYVISLYRDVANELSSDIKKASKNSLNERWLKDYRKQFDKQTRELYKLLKINISENMKKSVEFSNQIQLDFFHLLDEKFDLSISDTFTNMFSNIPSNALNELISGNFYKDGKGLSKRLWSNAIKNKADIDYIIQKGLLEKKTTYELAKDLEMYINPSIKHSMDFKKIYPSVGNKKIEYNSFRLAVTSISHAYQLGMKRSCKKNPFVEGIQWNTSNSHRETCEVCKNRNGKIYTSDTLPLDHPNGMCFFTPVVNKSLQNVGSELKDWLNGGSNPKLDKWYKQYGKEFK